MGVTLADIKGGTHTEGAEENIGLKRDEVTGGWRKLHEELHNLYFSPNIIRMIM
jgi:hypothetical protein